MNKRHHPFLIAMAIICAASLLMSGILFSIQILPDILAGGRVMSRGEIYEENWTLEYRQGDIIHIELSAVDVEIRTVAGDAFGARFSGRRVQDGENFTPYISAESTGGVITIRENRSSDRQIIRLMPFDDNIQGRLTLEIPEVQWGRVQISTFSGAVQAESLHCESFTADTSSGSIHVAGIQADDALSCTAFSGKVQIIDSSAGGRATLSTSSGAIEAQGLAADSLSHNTFSGSTTLERVSIRSVEISSSSGSITGKDIQGQRFSADTFSGKIDLQGIDTELATQLSTGSGAITMKAGAQNAVSVHTFSGSISLAPDSVATVMSDSSSGAFHGIFPTDCDATVDTFSGAVVIELPETASFQLTTETFSGGVFCDFPSARRAGGDEDAFIVGSGEKTLTISTSSGSITVRPLQAVASATMSP